MGVCALQVLRQATTALITFHNFKGADLETELCVLVHCNIGNKSNDTYLGE